MEWSPARRLAFRFGLLFAALLLFPFPLGYLPWTDELPQLLNKPLEALVSWCATAVLGLDEPSTQPTGSGDSTYAYVFHLVALVLAAAGAAAWTALDRRRAAYPRLAAGALVALRYYLGFTLLVYAFAKLSQFPPPHPGRLDQRVGDMSPMGMLWTFMGSSQPYALFGGFAEGLGGALLLWRRTHVAGALVALATMSNVVALNLCYDVPVKLYSALLLGMAALILAPHAPRLIAAVLGRATEEVPPRPRRSPREERARRAAKALLLAAFAVQIYLQVDQSRRWMPPRHELHGIWLVEKFQLDGVERPPLVTDAERWHKVYLSHLGGVRPMTGPAVRFRIKVDPARRTITLEREVAEVWTYALSGAGDQATLVLSGTFGGKPFHAELRREPEPLLVTRGFHWINEVPYNR